MANEFSGKVVIVTGSSSGLGKSIAYLFASRGASVTINGRSQERLKSVFDELVQVSGGHEERFLVFQGDLNDKKARQDLVARTVEKFGRLDTLVCNAAVLYPNQSVTVATEEVYDDIMNTNLKSIFFLVQEAVPHLEATKGNIISISAASSHLPMPMITISILSKIALDQLTRILAVDLGPKGIRVNAVGPGLFPSLVWRNFGPALEQFNSAIPKTNAKRQPLQGISGGTDDLAEAVAFLASEKARFITGELIRVDGGFNLTGPIDASAFQE